MFVTGLWAGSAPAKPRTRIPLRRPSSWPLADRMDHDEYGFTHRIEREAVKAFDKQGLAAFRREAEARFEGKAEDGLEWPINKRVYATFESYKALFEWLLLEAKKRGYGTAKFSKVLFVADGAAVLWDLQAKCRGGNGTPSDLELALEARTTLPNVKAPRPTQRSLWERPRLDASPAPEMTLPSTWRFTGAVPARRFLHPIAGRFHAPNAGRYNPRGRAHEPATVSASPMGSGRASMGSSVGQSGPMDQERIYAEHAAEYDALVSAEDCDGHLLPAIQAIAPLAGASVLEVGAGTGRVTRLLVAGGARVVGVDLSPAMLDVARRHLEALGAPGRWELRCEDARGIEVDERSADLALAAWVFGHFRGWFADGWQHEVAQALARMERALKPGGALVLVETLGTGREDRAPPSPALAELP
jgi:predicted O-methyltransferase YrrM